MSDLIIKADALSRVFGRAEQALCIFDSLNLAVKKGERVAIVGQSGSGKSTLLQILGGLDKPSDGTVHLNGKNLSGLSDKDLGRVRNQELGFVYQFHHLIKELSAVENAMLPALIAGKRKDKAFELASDLLADAGLSHRRSHLPGQLSGGERQRVAICRALVNQPSCIMADEPTGNLDESSANLVFEMFLDLNKKYSTSLVMVTHSGKLAKRADRVLTLSGGALNEV